MKRIKLVALLLAVFLLLGCAPRGVEQLPPETYARKLLNYYRLYQKDAQRQIHRQLEQMQLSDPVQAEAWGKIMATWQWVDQEMELTYDVLPDNLPEDDSLGIVIMGYGLNPDGTIRPELEKRLRVGLASAKKYPNAWVILTGGPTAADNVTTEAGQMAKWLIEQGLSRELIIVENRSYSTELNARYSIEILRKSYPQIKSLAVVSSDYHIRRCHWLFEAEIILQGLENKYQVVSNAGYEAGYEGESGFWFEAQSLSNLLSLGLRQSTAPKLSQLTEIAVSGETSCFAGEMPNLTVTAYYDNGFSRDVTSNVEIHGLDTSAGEVLAEITYTENGITKSNSFPVTILELPTEPPTEPTVVTQPEPIQPATSVPLTDVSAPAEIDGKIFWITGGVIALVVVILSLPKKKKRGKYQK